MPIYEFKCLNCNEVTEFIFTSANEEKEIKCGVCGGSDLEKIMSASNFSMSSGKDRPMATANTKTCSSGSCSTLELPGIGD